MELFYKKEQYKKINTDLIEIGSLFTACIDNKEYKGIIITKELDACKCLCVDKNSGMNIHYTFKCTHIENIANTFKIIGNDAFNNNKSTTLTRDVFNLELLKKGDFLKIDDSICYIINITNYELVVLDVELIANIKYAEDFSLDEGYTRYHITHFLDFYEKPFALSPKYGVGTAWDWYEENIITTHKLKVLKGNIFDIIRKMKEDDQQEK